MECGICSCKFGKHRQPTCASCARADAYIPRLERVALLQDKEKLNHRVQTVLKPYSQVSSSEISTASQFVEVAESARKLEVESQRGQIAAIEGRLKSIREQHDLLRAQIDQARQESAARQAQHKVVQNQIRAARQKLGNQSREQIRAVQADSKQLDHSLSKHLKYTVRARKMLCEETAILVGLSKRKGRSNDGRQLDHWYSISKVPIPDLRELNVMHPEHINASLAHLSRLLVTTSHYLGIRLPAEIIVPYPGYPRTLILSLQSSYRPRPAGPPRKPRYLDISKPLPLLAKDETPTYNLFVDGVVLLAYNVAWLCRTQGAADVDSWEALCALGSNVHSLFMSSPARGASPAERSGAPITRFGELSHAAATSNLLSAGAAARMATWALPSSLARLGDRLKAHLLAEMSGAEWELLDDKEWEEEREDEKAVLIGGARWSLAAGESRLGALGLGMSYMTATAGGPVQEVEGLSERGGEGDSSGRGWMKLKKRSSRD